MRWGVALGKVHGAARLGELARQCEAWGYDEVWISNERFYRDMYVGLTLAAAATRRVRLGSFVVDPYSAHPALTAAAHATLDEVAGGRVLLGIGAGGTGFPAMGLARPKPAVAITEAVQVIRRLLAGETVSFAGEVVRCHEARLSVAPRPHIPLVVATQGERVLQAAGAVADEVMISTFAGDLAFRMALGHVEAGARAAGRALASIPIVARIDVAIDGDLAAARAAVKPILAVVLLITWPRWEWVAVEGLRVPEALAEVVRTGDYHRVLAAAPLLPDAFADRYAWVGPPERVAAQVAALAGCGLAGVTILPHAAGGDVVPTIRRFIEEVRPRVERA